MSHIGYLRDQAERRKSSRFEAKYPGRCVLCDEGIEVGDMLRWDGDVAVHAACEDVDPAPARETCPKCWTEFAVNGECACDD